ncbi:hypothetical protein LCGC14_2222440 [marine sediment metagenome]|uniref:Uncharacterized protein n=1 Tax=marine sediment metagenome TaxID=412755 RepID=A0A0F9G630_9ZZZZ
MVRVKTPPITKPKPCTKVQGFAHEWDINSPDGSRYVWGKCKFCRARRLFKTAWPAKLDWIDQKAQRKREERKELRREVRAKKIKESRR